MREIPESELEGESEEARWYFEEQRKEWEAEQRIEDQQPTTTEEQSNG